LFWFSVATWLLWRQPVRYDDYYYTYWARMWIAGDLHGLAEMWTGTLIRPYVYPMFLGATWFRVPEMLSPNTARDVMSVVQGMIFVAVTFRLTKVTETLHHALPKTIIVRLLCMPFAVLTNAEVLSESLSLSIMAFVVAMACPLRSRAGNVAGVMIGCGLLGMTRVSQLPVAIMVIALTLLVTLLDRRTHKKAWAIAFGGAVVGLFGVTLAFTPQALLMVAHTRLVPDDPTLWGVGSSQLLWSQQMGKYATVVGACPQIPMAGVVYPLPFATSAPSGTLWWYLEHPFVAVWHMFQAVNWDFPTTYVTTFNPWITLPLNAISVAVVVIGLWTLVRVAPAIVPALAHKAPILGIVLAGVAMLWVQSGFTAVETRFGIIPWSGMSVAAVWGVRAWWSEAQSGRPNWWTLSSAVLATCVGVTVSRLAVASVPAFQQLEGAGCWR
jgi:hypothetical protein